MGIERCYLQRTYNVIYRSIIPDYKINISFWELFIPSLFPSEFPIASMSQYSITSIRILHYIPSSFNKHSYDTNHCHLILPISIFWFNGQFLFLNINLREITGNKSQSQLALLISFLEKLSALILKYTANANKTFCFQFMM